MGDERTDSSPPAVVHVDLDGAKHIFANNGWRYDSAHDPLFDSGMRHLLRFLDRNGITATLFAIAEDLQDPIKRRWLEQAVNKGHEIASHSLTHPRLYDLDLAGKREEIALSRESLEEALGVEVHGFRAPSYSIDHECLAILAECGYRYDSSVYPIPKFADQLRVGSLSQKPFRHAAGRGVWELPLPNYKPGLFPFHPCYALIVGRTYFRWRLAAFRRTLHPLVMLFHLTDFADPLPKEQLPGWKAKIMTLSHLSSTVKEDRCGQMLEAVRRRYRVLTTAELLQEQEQNECNTQTA